MKIQGLINFLLNKLFGKEENKVEFLELTESVLGYYRKNVKGNRGISEDQARRKLTRNMQLAYKYREESSGSDSRSWYSYGRLRFIVKEDKVVWIANWQKKHRQWQMDEEKYVELSKAYGIEDYKGK